MGRNTSPPLLLFIKKQGKVAIDHAEPHYKKHISLYADDTLIYLTDLNKGLHRLPARIEGFGDYSDF